jgi:hypothetical protein
MAKTSATPWGQAIVLDELSIQQRAGEKRFSSTVQLLQAGGERLVRFSYATSGAARRGPVTLRARDLERLRSELVKHRELADALGFDGGHAGSGRRTSTAKGGA